MVSSWVRQCQAWSGRAKVVSSLVRQCQGSVLLGQAVPRWCQAWSGRAKVVPRWVRLGESSPKLSQAKLWLILLLLRNSPNIIKLIYYYYIFIARLCVCTLINMPGIYYNLYNKLHTCCYS